MGVRAIRPGTTWDYVPEDDRELPPEEQTVFMLRVLTARERARISDDAGTMSLERDEFRPRTGSTALETLRVGLAGWRNFCDEDGVEVPFESNNNGRLAAYEAIDQIPPRLRTELTNAITRGNALDEADEGN